MPKVSIIMTVFNTAPYLKEAIDSILNQTYGDFEFIIVNDGSTDSSARIIAEYTDSRIVFVNNEKNRGLIYSLNSALKIAKGKYIARMDSDDISEVNRLEIQYDFLEKNQDIFLVAGSFEYINSEGKFLSREIISMSNQDIVDCFPHSNPIHHPTVMFRQNTLVLYREKAYLCEDRDLWFILSQKGLKFFILPTILLKYRVHSSSVSMSKKVIQNAFINQVNKWYFERNQTGVDSYDQFDMDTFILHFNNKTNSNESKIKELKFIFKESVTMKDFRVATKEFWKRDGLVSWPLSYFYYVASFLPSFAIIMLKKLIWKK
jgi:glycosyltransferase involved in cell wall biosynthesis